MQEDIKEVIRKPRTIIIEVDTIGSLFRGLLYGSLIGAAIALLATPQSGEKNRQFVSEKGGELLERAQVVADEARVRARQVVASARGMEGSNGNSGTGQELRTENQVMESENRKTYDL